MGEGGARSGLIFGVVLRSILGSERVAKIVKKCQLLDPNLAIFLVGFWNSLGFSGASLGLLEALLGFFRMRKC